MKNELTNIIYKLHNDKMQEIEINRRLKWINGDIDGPPFVDDRDYIKEHKKEKEK